MGVSGFHPLIAFAGGGTGGHLYPMLSVAHEIRRRAAGARFVFFTTRRPIDERTIRHVMAGDDSLEIVPQAVLPLPGSLRRLPRFLSALGASNGLCMDKFRRERPAVVVGSGGYGSVPPVRAARRRGIRTVLLNPDVFPGRANRHFASWVDIVFVQWEEARSQLRRRANVHVVGCPIRGAFAQADRSAGIRRFRLDPAKKTLLVTGASQGAHTINQAMMAIGDAFAQCEGWQVLHLAGEVDAASVREAYRRFLAPATVLAYTEHMPDALAAADLVLSRAGASTLAEIAAVGVASVLMPYPFHANQHQLANAEVLRDAGAAIIVRDHVKPEDNAPALWNALRRVMSNEESLSCMAGHAAELGTLDAAAMIAEEVLALARAPVAPKTVAAFGSPTFPRVKRFGGARR